MKIKDFIQSFKEEKFSERINELSNILKEKRSFKYYEDFEDILDGISENILREHIKKEEFFLPEKFAVRNSPISIFPEIVFPLMVPAKV